jgi:hypothetical protein
MKARLARALRAVTLWCRRYRHLGVDVQARILAQKLRGHYAYYGITGNIRALQNFRHQVLRIWWKWLQRRSQRSKMPWDVFFKNLLVKYPLPMPRIVHSAFRSAKL